MKTNTMLSSLSNVEWHTVARACLSEPPLKQYEARRLTVFLADRDDQSNQLGNNAAKIL